MKTVVETYSGYKADEYPVRFHYDNRWLEIIDIEDRWYGPDYSYFRVFTDDCHRYILKQDIKSNTWNVTAVEANTDS